MNPSHMTSQMRIKTLKEKMSEANFQGYLATLFSNIRYLTASHRFSNTSLYLLIATDTNPILYVEEMGPVEVEEYPPSLDVETVKKGEKAEDKVAAKITELQLRRVGFDELSFMRFRAIHRKLANVRLELRPTILSRMRQVKDNLELKLLTEACKLADIGMKTALETVNAGLREYEIAAEAEYAMRKHGSEGSAFETIVASGARSALPHGVCSDRKLRDGDPVIIDLGARFRGYNSDITRTVFVGKPSPRHIKVYKLVHQAQEAAFSSLNAGMGGAEADRVARRLIEENGYGSYFVHALGHGIGVDVHEEPRLATSSKDELRERNVITVEPGIYLPKKFGVRIEDMAVVTKEGLKILTECEKGV